MYRRPILRDARTPVRALRDLPAGALLRMRTAESAARRRTVFGHSHLTMSNSPDLLVPAARLRPGFCIVASLTRIEGWAERRETFGCSGTRSACHLASKDARERAYDAARQALARRLASHDAGRSPLGAPPWRFFTRGRRSGSGMTRIRRASSSQPGRSAWRAGSRASRGERLQAACRRTPRLAPHSGSFSRTRPQ